MNWLRRHLLRVGDGSPELLYEVGRRLLAGKAKERLTRAGAVAAGLWLFWVMLDAWPWLAGVVLAVWCWKAWHAADVEERQEEEQAEAPTQMAPSRIATPDEIRAWIIPKIRALIADRNGVHLDTLLARLIDEGHLSPAARITGLRKYLEANGIPVRDSVNIGNVTRVGIHRDDLITVAAGGAGPDRLAPPPPDPFEPQ